MANFGEFGQLMALIDLANQAQYNAANTLIEKKKVKGELQLSQQELAQREKLAQLDIAYKNKELTQQESLSKRRDELYKDIALYVGIGLGALIILITLGAMFVGAKREEQFEYLVEK